MLELDHLIIASTDLARDVPAIEAQLGVPLAPGGQHEAMGTHNRLLSLGPEIYLELIAINPTASAPDVPRWYALDDFSGAPRLTHWAARCPDLDAALRVSPLGTGKPWQLHRDALRWRMAVPETGQTPFDGAFPALLEWQSPHPAPKLEDLGFRLQRLVLETPDPDGLRKAISAVGKIPELVIERAELPGVHAELKGPAGPVRL